MISCKNCGHSYEGKYCPQCRQSADTERITWHEVFHHVWHAVFHADRGLLYTIKELLLRPSRTLKDYLDGKRISHFNPFLFLLIAGGITSFLFFSLHLQPPVREISLEQVEHVNATLAHKYFALVGIVFLLLLSLTDFFFYRKWRLLMSELIVINTFQAAQIMVLTIVSIPFLLLQETLTAGAEPQVEVRTIIKVLILVYLFVTRYQFYEAKGKFGLSLRIALQLSLLVVMYEFAISRVIVMLIS